MTKYIYSLSVAFRTEADYWCMGLGGTRFEGFDVGVTEDGGKDAVFGVEYIGDLVIVSLSYADGECIYYGSGKDENEALGAFLYDGAAFELSIQDYVNVRMED